MSEKKSSVNHESPNDSPEVAENLPENEIHRIEEIVDEILNVMDEDEAARTRKNLRETAATSLNWLLKVQIWEKFATVWPIAIYYSFRGNRGSPPHLGAYCADPREWLARVNDRRSTLGAEVHAFLLESAHDFNFNLFYEPTPISNRGSVHTPR